MAKAAYPTIGIAALVMFGIVYFIGCLPQKAYKIRTTAFLKNAVVFETKRGHLFYKDGHLFDCERKIVR